MEKEIEQKLALVEITPLKGKTKLELDNIAKSIREWLSYGCKIDEACVKSGINPAWYTYICVWDKDLSLDVENLRLNPRADAMKTLADGIKNDPDLALKYLERKLPEEFAPVTKSKWEGKMEIDDKRVILD